MRRKILLALLYFVLIINSSVKVVTGTTTLPFITGIEKSAYNTSYLDDAVFMTRLNNKNLSETEAYKLLYENAKEVNNRILDTIYWALGGIATVILTLIGSNIFFNVRFNKKEVENIAESQKLQIEDIKNKLLLENREKLIEFESITKNEIQNEMKKANEIFLNQINTYNKSNTEQIKNYNEDFKNKFKESDNNFNEYKKYNTEQIEYLKNEINNNQKVALIAEYGLEAEIWDLRGVYDNVLSCLIKKAQLEIQLNLSLTDTLGKLIEALKNKRGISTFEQAKLNQLIKNINNQYELQINNIVELAKGLANK